MGEQDTETKLCEIRGHLLVQETELKLQTEAVAIRALSARGLPEKVNESDNLSHEHKRLFRTLSKYRAPFTSEPGLCKIFEYEFEVQCAEPIVGHTQPIPFPVRPGVCKKKSQCNTLVQRSLYTAVLFKDVALSIVMFV